MKILANVVDTHQTNNIHAILAFYKQYFYKQHQAEIIKNQTKVKYHPDTELWIKLSKKQVILF